jgi:hypothetical protein
MSKLADERENADSYLGDIAYALEALGFNAGRRRNTTVGSPGAIEGLTVALCGGSPFDRTSVAGALVSVAEALDRIAVAIEGQS